MSEQEAVLKTLIKAWHGADSGGSYTDDDQRLVWWFHQDDEDSLPRIEPRLQKRSKTGKWTKGRRVALKRLVEEDEPQPWMSEQDRQVCTAIEREYEYSGWGYAGRVVYQLNTEQAAVKLIGHPLVFRYDTNAPLELVRGEPVLRIERQGEQIRIVLDPLPKAEQDTLILRQGPDRYAVYVYNEQQRQVAKVIGQGLEAPAQAEALARKAADSLAGLVTVQSGIAAYRGLRRWSLRRVYNDASLVY